MRMVVSFEPVASVLPSGANTTRNTTPLCPSSTASSRPAVRSRGASRRSGACRFFQSPVDAASILPSGENATERTSLPMGSRCLSSPVDASQTLTSRLLARAMLRPSVKRPRPRRCLSRRSGRAGGLASTSATRARRCRPHSAAGEPVAVRRIGGKPTLPPSPTKVRAGCHTRGPTAQHRRVQAGGESGDRRKGAQSMPVIAALCPLNCVYAWPLSAFQATIVPSCSPLTKMRPLGEKARAVAGPWCRRRT